MPDTPAAWYGDLVQRRRANADRARQAAALRAEVLALLEDVRQRAEGANARADQRQADVRAAMPALGPVRPTSGGETWTPTGDVGALVDAWAGIASPGPQRAAQGATGTDSPGGSE